VTPLETTLRRAAADLAAANVGFALVGGLAVSIRTEPRFTRDADLAVAVNDDAAAEGLVRRLRTLGYRIEALVEQEAVGRLATARLVLSQERWAPVVDLLFASSGIEREIVSESEPLEVLSDLRVCVAQTGHLIALKVLSRDDLRRPQDLVDLRALVRVSSSGDLERSRHALALITARGYDRGRDLPAELDRLLQNSPWCDGGVS
jgi:predicted nucleotidyltransferase